MSVLAMLNKTCVIRLWTNGKSAATAGPGDTYEQTASVPCKVDILDSRRISQPSMAGVTHANVIFPFGTSVPCGSDLVNVTGYDDWIFTVTSDPVDDCGRGAYLRVEATHTQGQVS